MPPLGVVLVPRQVGVPATDHLPGLRQPVDDVLVQQVREAGPVARLQPFDVGVQQVDRGEDVRHARKPSRDRRRVGGVTDATKIVATGRGCPASSSSCVCRPSPCCPFLSPSSPAPPCPAARPPRSRRAPPHRPCPGTSTATGSATWPPARWATRRVVPACAGPPGHGRRVRPGHRAAPPGGAGGRTKVSAPRSPVPISTSTATPTSSWAPRASTRAGRLRLGHRLPRLGGAASARRPRPARSGRVARTATW